MKVRERGVAAERPVGGPGGRGSRPATRCRCCAGICWYRYWVRRGGGGRGEEGGGRRERDRGWVLQELNPVESLDQTADRARALPCESRPRWRRREGRPPSGARAAAPIQTAPTGAITRNSGERMTRTKSPALPCSCLILPYLACLYPSLDKPCSTHASSLRFHCPDVSLLPASCPAFPSPFSVLPQTCPRPAPVGSLLPQPCPNFSEAFPCFAQIPDWPRPCAALPTLPSPSPALPGPAQPCSGQAKPPCR